MNNVSQRSARQTKAPLKTFWLRYCNVYLLTCHDLSEVTSESQNNAL